MAEGLFSTKSLNETADEPASDKVDSHKDEENDANKATVKKVKSGPVLKEVIPEEVRYAFTCKKCGGHDFQLMATNQSKWGGGGLEPNKIKVCSNCMTGFDD